jgi:CHAT domain-containing protein
MPRYRLKWHGGRGAQIEIFTPPVVADAAVRHFLKYSAALRPSLRTVQECLAAGPSLQMADVRLDAAVKGLRTVGCITGAPPPPPPPVAPGGVAGTGDGSVRPELQQTGSALFDFVVNSPAEADLRTRGLFLELGTDEVLVNYPWELMYDDEDFLCLKHYVGRYVNTTKIGPPRMQAAAGATEWDTIGVLVISVPGPPGAPFLPGAKAETDALMSLFAGMPHVTQQVLRHPDATFVNVKNELRSGRYQIVHFCGHATFNPQDPRSSAILLQDYHFTAGQILTHLRSAVLCVVNACQTAQQAAEAWNTELNNFSLGRAFMEADSYLLGSRWKLSDQAAPKFAIAFYKALLKDWKPVGEAVQTARKVCKGLLPEDEECRGALPADDVGWASYVYYGDPRLAFEVVP